MGDVCVQLVAIGSLLFWVICSFSMCDSVVSGYQAGWWYEYGPDVLLVH